jgi:Amt family ammonium transporter
LWFGWFGFNAGYTMTVTKGNFRVAAVICVNTVVSPAFAALTCLVFEKCFSGIYDLPNVLNAVVSGLVGITGPCGVVSPGGAVVIGIVSGLTYCLSVRAHARLWIDDPVCAIAVHAWPGLWGAIAPGFFATSEQVKALGYNAKAGLFYGGNINQLGVQCLGSITILAWTALMSWIVFFSLRLLGLLRVSKEEEELGLDISKHGVQRQVLDNKASMCSGEAKETACIDGGAEI